MSLEETSDPSGSISGQCSSKFSSSLYHYRTDCLLEIIPKYRMLFCKVKPLGLVVELKSTGDQPQNIVHPFCVIY